MTHTKIDPLDEFRNVPRPATPGPWDRTFVREAVRHIARNCDWIEGDDPDFSWHKSGDWEAIASLPEILDKYYRLVRAVEVLTHGQPPGPLTVRERAFAILRGEI